MKTQLLKPEELKPGYCIYCGRSQAYSYGDHTECYYCERIWAS